jgi:transposase
MLTVDDYELIRRKHLIDGASQRAIARELGHSRNTVAKAMVQPIPPGYRLQQARAHPVLDPVKAIIDAWLDLDRSQPRKQRHTAMRIYERLCEEHQFPGDYSTVRRYLQQRRQYRAEVFMPLEFGPGEEAQVDWHEGWLRENGVARKAQFFCLRLCYSKASFVWPYERANLESFLDGHVRAFAYLGGVPRRLAYDNLKSAVIQVLHGKERRLNLRFKELRSWYLFDTRFCNIARGNEKGNVENLAKRSERTYLTPLPEITSLGELGPRLLADCQRDLELPAPKPHQARTRRQLLDEERPALLPLPAAAFPACRQISTTIDKRSLVTVESNSYSAPVRWAHHPVVVKVFVDRLELWCEQQQQVSSHPRKYAQGQYILAPEHYLNLLRTKPGSLDNARPFKGQPWGEDFDLLRKELEYRYEGQGTRKFIDVLLLFTQYPEEQVKQAVGVCVRRRAFSDEAVAGLLRNQPLPPTVRLDLSHRPELMNLDEGIRPVAVYDQLRAGEEVAA